MHNNNRMICTNCGKRLGNKEPGQGATWHAGVCEKCGEKSYVTEARDFGIVEKDDFEETDLFKHLFKK